MNKFKRIGIPVIITLIYAAIVYYFALPALNIHSAGCWIYVISILALYGLLGLIGDSMAGGIKFGLPVVRKSVKVSFAAAGGLILVMLIILLIGSPMFNAKKYADILKVDELDFSTDLSESLSPSSIALMDTDSARMLGDREIGSL